jgi:hypothetical protein
VTRGPTGPNQPMSVSSPQLTVSLSANVALSGTNVSGSIAVSDLTRLGIPSGSTSGSADGAFALSGTVTAGTPVTIDLAALHDPLGNAITAGHLVAMKVSNTSATGAGNLTYGGGTDPAANTGSVPVSPGGTAAIADPAGTLLPIVSGTTQYLQLTASAGTVSYSVSGLTRSA